MSHSFAARGNHHQPELRPPLRPPKRGWFLPRSVFAAIADQVASAVLGVGLGLFVLLLLSVVSMGIFLLVILLTDLLA